MRVVLGGVDIQKDETYDQVIPVQRAIVHEGYSQSPFALYNDVGEALTKFCTVFCLSTDYISAFLTITIAVCFFFHSPAPAESDRQAVLCKGDSLCEDSLSDQSAIQQRHRVCDLRVGRHGNT